MLRIIVINDGPKRLGSVKTVNSLMMELETRGDVEDKVTRLMSGFGDPSRWARFDGPGGIILTYTARVEPLEFGPCYDELFDFAGHELAAA